MTIYAMLDKEDILTSPSPKKDYKKFELENPKQLYVKRELIEDKETLSLELKPFNIFKEEILKQIDAVYNYLVKTPQYEDNEDFKFIVDTEKVLATKELRYFTAHTVSIEDNKAVRLERLKEAKRRDFYLLKKETQDANVTSPIGKKDFTFFGGSLSASKYNNTLALGKALGKTEGIIEVVEGLVSINEKDLQVAIVKIGSSVYEAWLKNAELLAALDKAKTEEEVEAITW